MWKWATESASKQYQHFKQLRTDRNAKIEKRLDKIEEAEKKIKEQINQGKIICKNNTVCGLMEELIDAKMTEMGTDSQKRAILKCQLQLRKKVISLRLSNDRKLSFLSEKG